MQSVPDVVGQNVDTAKTMIQDAKFEVGNIEMSYDPNVKENDVISQDPTSLMRALQGSKVNLVVSKGPEMVTVPEVVNKSRKEAIDALEKAGFNVDFTEDQFDKKVEAGKVCKQDPEGGQKSAKGSTIFITISKGTEAVQVPDVVNYSESDARAALETAGFTVRINREFSDKVDEGFVMSQTPGAGQKLDKGSSVTITVSKGSNDISVPDVIGLTVSQATSKLQAAGFNVSVSGAGEKVVQMNPVAGNKVSKGSTITIYVA